MYNLLRERNPKLYVNYLSSNIIHQFPYPATDIPKDEITRTIFIKNLPYELTEDELGDAFRHCGEIENVRMIYNSVHKHFKG